MYCIYFERKLKIVAFALLFLKLRHGIIVNGNFSMENIFEENTTEKLDITTNGYCASLQFSNSSGNYEFDIFDREDVNSCVNNILDSKSHGDFEYVRVRKGCEVKYCFLDRNACLPYDYDNAHFNTTCYTFRINRALINTFEMKYVFTSFPCMVAVRCSCMNLSRTCTENNCENVHLKDNECARLYEESECRECRYEHISLKTRSPWIPKKGFFVGSLFVNHGCQLDIKSSSELSDERIISFKEFHNNILLSYMTTPKKPVFTCSCGNNYSIRTIGHYTSLRATTSSASKCTIRFPNSTTATSKDLITETTTDLINGKNIDSTSVKTITAFALPLVLVIIVIAIAYLKTLRNNKILQGIASEAIARFEAGESDSVVDYLHKEHHDYVSCGYIQALKLPYQKKYEISRNCFSIEETRKLGAGAYGKVLLGKLKTSKCNNNYTGETLVAVKIAKCSSSINYFTSLLDEIKILAYIGSHPNVVEMIGACTENIKQGDALILLEYCSNGSFKSYLHSNRATFFNSVNTGYDEVSVNTTGYAVFNEIGENLSNSVVTIKPQFLRYLYKWAKDILAGMEYLSSIQVVHIDLAARNILLTDDLVAKICDFGLSRRMNDLVNYVKLETECPLPFRNMALESLTEYRFSTQSDIWSYGVTLWEVFTLGEDPYGNISNQFELITYLRNNNRLQKPPHSSNEIYKEMLRCWADEPINRPNFTELKTFFESLSELEGNTRC